MKNPVLLPNVLMPTGEVFKGEEISELVNEIVDKFAERGLSVIEGKIVLDKAEELLGQYSIIKRQ